MRCNAAPRPRGAVVAAARRRAARAPRGRLVARVGLRIGGTLTCGAWAGAAAAAARRTRSQRRSSSTAAPPATCSSCAARCRPPRGASTRRPPAARRCRARTPGSARWSSCSSASRCAGRSPARSRSRARRSCSAATASPRPRSAAGSATVLREHLAEQFPELTRAMSDRPGGLRRPAVRLLPRVAARPAGRRALDDAGGAAAAGGAARDARARRLAAAAPELPGAGEHWWAPRASGTSTASPPPSWPRPSGPTRRSTIQAPENTTALAGVDPARMARAARSPRADPRGRDAAPLVLHALADAGRRPAAGHGHAPSSRRFVRRALFLDRDDPAAAWGELRALQERLIERLGRASELRIEADGTDLRLGVGGPHLGQLRRRRNMPSGEVFTGPHRGLRRGPHPLHDPVEPARRRGRRHRARVPRRRASSTRAPSAATSTCSRRSTPTPARACSGEIGIGTNSGIDRPDRRDPVRREDRRHGPPRARPLVSRDRRHERRRCTGT